MKKEVRKRGFCREKRERSYEEYEDVREMKRVKKWRRKEIVDSRWRK